MDKYFCMQAIGMHFHMCMQNTNKAIKCLTYLNYWKRNRLHNDNTPMQYTANFHDSKNDNFQVKNCDIFFNFALNIDRGHTLELLH